MSPDEKSIALAQKVRTITSCGDGDASAVLSMVDLVSRWRRKTIFGCGVAVYSWRRHVRHSVEIGRTNLLRNSWSVGCGACS